MPALKFLPAESEAALKARIIRMLGRPAKSRSVRTQLALGLGARDYAIDESVNPTSGIGSFLDFVSESLPDGDVYLFGGLLRDMAMYGRRGFGSDIDLVVEGDWSYLQRYLSSLGAMKNKFGGYRLTVATWPIDIWHAQETWAIKENLVRYENIATLTKTTVLNWDAMLMNWRTRELIFRHRYFEELAERNLDVVLESNPNPLGMAVRVLRHLCQKDARGVTEKAVRYLSNAARTFDFEQMKDAEIESYGDTHIAPCMYQHFRLIDGRKDDIRQQYRLASSTLQQQIKLAG